MIAPTRHRWLAVVAVLLYAACFATYASIRRNPNWDIVPYVALSTEAATPAERSASVYAALESELDPRTYAALVAKTAYRKRCAAEPRVFDEQLGFYAYRKLYPFGLGVLHASGLSWTGAATGLSVAAGALLAALALAWGWRARGWTGLAVLALWIPAAGTVDIARLWTPDTLGALLAFGGAYLWLARKQPELGACLLVASVFARSSNVVFVGLLFVALLFAGNGRRERVVALVGGLATAALYLALARLGNGWWPMFVHTCIERVPLPRSEPPVFSIGAYGRAIAGGLPYFHLEKAGLWIALTAMFLAVSGAPRRERWLAGALLVSAIVQFLAAPVLWDRLFVAQQLLIAVLWLEIRSAPRSGDPERVSSASPQRA